MLAGPSSTARSGPCSTRRSIPARALLGSIAQVGSNKPLYAILGQPPNLAQLPLGSAFHRRWVDAMPRCVIEHPMATRFGPDRTARYWVTAVRPAKEADDSASA
jgi:ABC-type dipeptide/oligopeptide/nickel transport system ATPase component